MLKVCIKIQVNRTFFYIILFYYNRILILQDTCFKKPGSTDTLIAAETTQSLASEDNPPSFIFYFSYPKIKFGKKERIFLPVWYEKCTQQNYDEAEDHVFCIVCKNVNDRGILINVKVHDSFVKTGYSN